MYFELLGILPEYPKIPREQESAREIEHLSDALSNGGHDGGVEQGVQQTQKQGADNNGDEDLDTGIDVAFGLGVGDCGYGTGSQGCDLGADGVHEFLHSKLPLSLNYDFVLVGWMGDLAGEVKETFDALGDGRHDGVVEQTVQQTQQ